MSTRHEGFLFHGTNLWSKQLNKLHIGDTGDPVNICTSDRSRYIYLLYLVVFLKSTSIVIFTNVSKFLNKNK